LDRNRSNYQNAMWLLEHQTTENLQKLSNPICYTQAIKKIPGFNLPRAKKVFTLVGELTLYELFIRLGLRKVRKNLIQTSF
jgi:hypothetical protein